MARTVRRTSFATLRTRQYGPDARLAGRWSLVPVPMTSGDQRASAWCSLMLDRYGIVTSGSVRAESFPGGFASAYDLFTQFEQSGYCRRGNFIEGLGGAQFSAPSTVDRLRDGGSNAAFDAVTLSASDPANPYGAALAWPKSRGYAHPRRNPGALVTLAAGTPLLYLERGGKTALSFGSVSAGHMRLAARSLVDTCRSSGIDSFTIETIDGLRADKSEWFKVLCEAGFDFVPRGLAYSRGPL